jgi:hypothetical protein
MLSRSTSNGAHNLRRAKSTSCVQRRTSNSSLIDPVAAKQHALVAATLAYERGHGRDWAGSYQNERKTEPRRRHSNRARRSEGQGIHFEASLAPHRQPNKKLFHFTSTSNDHSRSRRATMSSFQESSKQNSLSPVDIVESSKTRIEISPIEADSTPDVRRIRRSRSMFAPLSLRPATSIDAISFNVSTPRSMLETTMRCTDETTTVVLGEQGTSDHDMPQVPPTPLTHNTIYKVDERVAKARDHHLQQFQMKKIRHRASFMLTPFKRRAGSVDTVPTLSGTSNNGVTYGSGRSTPAQDLESLQRNITSERKQSTSLKDKIRRAFRKPSALHTGLPIQQVEASRAHYGDILSASSTMSTIRAGGSNILLKNAPETTRLESFSPALYSCPNQYRKPRSSAVSEAAVNTSTSRVTSWADSTLAGTTASCSSNPLAIIHEDQQQSKTSSIRSQRRSSFGLFRRGAKRSLVTNTEPSPGDEIYVSAEINAYGSDSEIQLPASNRNFSESHERLPSQVRQASLRASRASSMIKATVRVVSSGSHSTSSYRSSTQRNRSMNSIVLPVLNLKDREINNQSPELPKLSLTPRWREKRKQSKLQGFHMEPQLVAPSTEEIAGRVERSENRWKQSLDESQSLFYPHISQIAPADINTQYDDKVCLQSAANLSALAVEDVFFKLVSASPEFRSVDVTSPSLYSRNTNSASPKRRPNDSAISLGSDDSNNTGTAVIITSNHNGKYSVESPKKADSHLAKSSRDWRDWISSQVHDLETPPSEDLTLSGEFVSKPTDSGHRREHAQILDGENVSIGCIPTKPTESPPIDLCSIKQQPSEPRNYSRFGPDDRPSSRLHDRPELKNRSASCMNERFPLINTGRLCSRKASPPNVNERPENLVSAKKRNKNEDDISPSSSSLTVANMRCQTRLTGIPRPQTAVSFQRSRSSLAHYTTSDIECQNQAKPAVCISSHIPRPVVTPLRRPQSALDVRAARRNRVTPTPISNVDSDPTLVSISKGPYQEGIGSPKLTSIQHFPSLDKENSPFPKETSPVHTMGEDESSSIMLKSSPTSGQRLVEQFLTARRMRDEARSSVGSSPLGSPAFL